MTEQTDTRALIEELVNTAVALHRMADDADVASAELREVASFLPRIRAALERGQEERHHARNLLAVIHRDGGHYVTDHGFQKACEDAGGVVLGERERVQRIEEAARAGIGKYARQAHDRGHRTAGHVLSFGECLHPDCTNARSALTDKGREEGA